MPAGIKVLGGEEIFQVAVVSDHLERVLGPLQPASLLLQDNFQGPQLQFTDVIALLDGIKIFGKEGAGMMLLGTAMVLRQHCPITETIEASTSTTNRSGCLRIGAVMKDVLS